MISRLDLDIAIYRDRVQVTHRASGAFADQRAEYPFSSGTALVANPRFLEDTLVRAIRQVLKEGGFALREPIARIVRCEEPLADGDLAKVEEALRETGMSDIVFAPGD